MLESIDKYRELGIDDFKLRTLDDVITIYGINPKLTPGFESLSEKDKKTFEGFFLNFYNSWGLDARLNLKPLKIEPNGDYLKFTFNYYEMLNSITVVNENGWR